MRESVEAHLSRERSWRRAPGDRYCNRYSSNSRGRGTV